jgi:hypothetical protein
MIIVFNHGSYESRVASRVFCVQYGGRLSRVRKIGNRKIQNEILRVLLLVLAVTMIGTDIIIL